MRNIALILALVIVVGIIVLVAMPKPTTAPTPQTITDSVPRADTPSVTPDANPEPIVATPAGDAGMEFPIPDEDVASTDALVTYTSNGFEPSMVTVSRGDTVRFLNQSSQKMWVGANNHPTHTLYPVKNADDCFGSSFDQCAGVDAGAFWDFTFSEAGSFGYHNHLRARDGGNITVE